MNVKRDNLWVIFWMLFIIPFLSIYGIKNSIGETTYQAWQIISVCGLFIAFASNMQQIKINGIMALFILYQLEILSVSIIKQGFSFGIFTVTIATILIFIMLQSPAYNFMLQAIGIIVILCSLLNIYSMLKSSASPNINYFIGGKNALSMFLLPGAFLIILKKLEKNEKVNWKTFLQVIICLISVFMGLSGTGVVTTIIATVLMLINIRHTPPKWVYLAIIISFYIMLLLMSEKIFETDVWLDFTETLGKDSTLTSRDVIWRIVKKIISENWIFGSGRGTEITYMNTWREYQVIYEAHNLVLEILMEGGVVALTIYSLLIKKTVKFLDLSIQKNSIIFIALCVVLINGLTESTVNNFFVTIILGIACRYATEYKGDNKIYEHKT